MRRKTKTKATVVRSMRTMMTMRMRRTRMMKMTSDPFGSLACFFSLFGVLMPKGEKLFY
jgi:hypothetical protein